MTTYKLSEISDGQAITFDPANDVLDFDVAGVSAADPELFLFIGSSGTFSAGGKTFDVTLPGALAALTTSNVLFRDGSKLIIGDNTTSFGFGNGLFDDAANTLVGGAGNDYLAGLGGDDLLQGKGGDDYMPLSVAQFNFGHDTVSGGTGRDTVAIGRNPAIPGGATIDLAAGTVVSDYGSAELTGIESAFGSPNADRLIGSATRNHLDGYQGNDTIGGAAGADTLTGGAGRDTFVFDAPAESGVDRITDFRHGRDHISLDDDVFAALGPVSAKTALAPENLCLGSDALDADDFLIYDQASGALYYDADGDGAGSKICFATLKGHPVLDAGDFQVVG